MATTVDTTAPGAAIRFDTVGELGVYPLDEQPAARPDETVIRPQWLGICGSDLHVLHGRHPFVRPPVVTGHEVFAHVEGSGDRVLVNPLVACGQCAACSAGVLNTCEQAKVLGFGLPGAARTRMTVGTAQLHAVPDSVPDELACLAEPLATAVHAARRAHNPAGLDTVLVIGAGPIGLAVLLALSEAGADHIEVVEPVAEKRALAARLGAARTHADVGSVAARSATAVLDCVGSPATVAASADAAVAGGRVVAVGVGAATARLDLPLARMQRFEIDLVGSGMYVPADVDAALAFLARRQSDVGSLVTERYDLSRAVEAFEAAARPETVKVLIRMHGA